jgi:hypothetical protein
MKPSTALYIFDKNSSFQNVYPFIQEKALIRQTSKIIQPALVKLEAIKSLFGDTFYTNVNYFLHLSHELKVKELNHSKVEITFVLKPSFYQYFGLIRGFFALQKISGFSIDFDREVKSVRLETKVENLDQVIKPLLLLLSWLKDEHLFKLKLEKLRLLEEVLEQERRRILAGK